MVLIPFQDYVLSYSLSSQCYVNWHLLPINLSITTTAITSEQADITGADSTVHTTMCGYKFTTWHSCTVVLIM